MAHGFLTMAQKVGEGPVRPAAEDAPAPLRLGFSGYACGSIYEGKRQSLSYPSTELLKYAIEGIRQQHGGECWFYPPLVEAFRIYMYKVHNM